MDSANQWYVQEVASAIQGDLTAYSRLIEKSMAMVSSIAIGIVKDIDASEDVAQLVYISIWQKLHSLKNPASFLPWVRQTTRHAAYNYIRDNKTGNLFVDNKYADETEAILQQFKDENVDIESSLSREQQSIIVADLVSKLPEQSRDVVILYYREEQSTKQVAELLGLSEANVRQRLTRARSVLKQEWLSRYGKLILATLPPLGFASVVASSLTVSSPVLAVTTATLLSSKSSGLAKVLLLLGGGGIGLFSGLLGLHLGASPAIRKAPNEVIKKKIISLRNLASAWLITAGIIFIASYWFTSGWVWPVITFILFFLGITLYVLKIWAIVDSKEYLDNQEKPFTSKYLFWGKVGGWTGYILGGLFGFGGLIIGLIGSGRL